MPARLPRRAFTMLEVSVAIALASMVVAGLYQLFLQQSRQLAFLDTQAQMNQNLRFALDVVTRSLRNAGLGTAGEVVGRLGLGGDENATLPAVIGLDGAGGAGSDVITVVHMDPSLTMDTSALESPSCDTPTLTFDLTMHDYARKILRYQAGEYLVCFDFASLSGVASYLWEITSVDTAGGAIGLASNTGLADFATACPSAETLPSVMTCSRAEVLTFYIDADDGDGMGPGSAAHPVLMLDLDYGFPEADDVPLVDDIEDLQFAYCLADETGASACTDPTSWQDGLGVGETPWMVRVSLVARSPREAPSQQYAGMRPALENHAGAAEGDHYYRQVISTEVTLRNLKLLSNL
ncbi:MAG: PilW family protein [Deltaproteobacteria bacterium]|nr:PilW family protein [Deltaproteobacteria bacterium]